jgi:hypothetical protein
MNFTPRPSSKKPQVRVPALRCARRAVAVDVHAAQVLDSTAQLPFPPAQVLCRLAQVPDRRAQVGESAAQARCTAAQVRYPPAQVHFSVPQVRCTLAQVP